MEGVASVSFGGGGLQSCFSLEMETLSNLDQHQWLCEAVAAVWGYRFVLVHQEGPDIGKSLGSRKWSLLCDWRRLQSRHQPGGPGILSVEV